MTAVAKWRRSTAAERRAAREAYRALKQAVENSPETAKRRATYRHDATRARALGKIRRMLAGRGSPIFSAG